MKAKDLKRWSDLLFKYRFTPQQIYNQAIFRTSRKSPILSYRPIWLLLYLSDLCPLRCKMCPHHTPGDSSSFEFMHEKEGYMTPELCEQIFQRFSESTLVMFAGVGEPMTNPHFFEVADLAAKYRKTINLVTSGVLIDDEKIQKFVQNPYFRKISVSLNADNPEDYRNITNTDDRFFAKAVTSIQGLLEARKKNNHPMEIAVSFVASKQSLSKVKNFIKFADDLGVDTIDIHNYIDFKIIETPDNQWTKLNSDSNVLVQLQDLQDYSQRQVRAKVNLPLFPSSEEFGKRCEWYFRNLAFDSKGVMGSCGRVMNPQGSYGNILDNEDIWNNKYMQSMRRAFLQPEKKLPSCCYQCVENF
jgi:radical SAM protein with 4Fe4S-binding SPASM domain